MTDFTTLGLAAPILNALESEGYAAPTPIQAKAIPAVLAGSDLLGIAQTGTGKTAAFALPILHRLAAERRLPMRKGCRALILSPTRELASQIADSFRTYGRNLGLTVAVVFGGVTPRKQIRDLSKGVDILIATPGRLLDHMGQKDIVLDGTEIFVLDEADQMLDLGFLKPIQRIAARIPLKRQTLFFSATMPNQIAELARDFLNDPVRASVAPVSSTAERVNQRIIHIESHRKRDILTTLCQDPQMDRALVFTRTKRGADRVAKHLETSGITVAAIHGNKSQGQRQRALDAFRAGRIRILVATDIAARGIDIDKVSHVVNFELPEVPEAYVHRIGRTGRAGASGIAISLCDRGERDLLRAIERLTNQSIPNEDMCDGSPNPRPGVESLRRRSGPRPANGQRTHNGTRSNAGPKRTNGEKRRHPDKDKRQENGQSAQARPHPGKQQHRRKEQNHQGDGSQRPQPGKAGWSNHRHQQNASGGATGKSENRTGNKARSGTGQSAVTNGGNKTRQSAGTNAGKPTLNGAGKHRHKGLHKASVAGGNKARNPLGRNRARNRRPMADAI